jgi:hypothetical protein
MLDHNRIFAVNNFIYTKGTAATTGYLSTAKMIEFGGILDANTKTVTTNGNSKN